MKFRNALTLVVGTFGMMTGAAHAQGDFAADVSAALEAHQLAVQLEHGWSTTLPMIEEARALRDSGDEEAASAAAARARLMAEQSLLQAQTEVKAWRARVLVPK